jgi:hypothetical protein
VSSWSGATSFGSLEMPTRERRERGLSALQRDAKARRPPRAPVAPKAVASAEPRRPDSNKKHRLELWYDRLSALTAPKCKSECNVPRSCCSAAYCEFALRYAKDRWGVELERTKHPHLPLMGPNGCTAAPYLRPLCTAHACEKHFEDPTFAERHQWLCSEIGKLESGISLKGPDEPSSGWNPAQPSEG